MLFWLIDLMDCILVKSTHLFWRMLEELHRLSGLVLRGRPILERNSLLLLMAQIHVFAFPFKDIGACWFLHSATALWLMKKFVGSYSMFAILYIHTQGLRLTSHPCDVITTNPKQFGVLYKRGNSCPRRYSYSNPVSSETKLYYSIQKKSPDKLSCTVEVIPYHKCREDSNFFTNESSRLFLFLSPCPSGLVLFVAFYPSQCLLL